VPVAIGQSDRRDANNLNLADQRERQPPVATSRQQSWRVRLVSPTGKAASTA
jgi:hypothetical protein